MKKGPFIIVSGHDLKDLENAAGTDKGEKESIFIRMEKCCHVMGMRD